MRKKWFAGTLMTAGITAVALMSGGGGTAYGADHRDGPVVNLDPTVDITDVYAWMSSDGTKVNLVLDVQGGPLGATAQSKFSTAAVYAMHITSGTKFGESLKKSTILCQFDAAQVASCWIQDDAGVTVDYVNGTASAAAGIKSTGGQVLLFAGLRNDPFFFNIRGFRAVATTVKGAAAMLKFDAAGCPTIDAATSSALVTLLKTGGAANVPATDDFGTMGNNTPALNGNVLSIVLQVPKAMLITGGNTLSVWASTNKSN